MEDEKLEELMPDEELLEEFKEAQEEYNEVISETDQSNDDIIEKTNEDITENNDLNGDNPKNSENKTNNKKKKIIICSIAIITIIVIISSIYLIFKPKTDNVEYVLEDSNVEKHSKAIESLPEETKDIMGINNNKTKSDEISEKIKKQNEEKKITKEYKEYEKLSDEEKKKLEVIPPKEKSKYDNPDDLKKDIDYDDGKLPKKYNLKDKIKIQVENQGGFGLCWDFASMKSLETNYALINNKNYDFSEMHVDYITSDKFYGDRQLHDGGNFVDFEKYSALNFGPVFENKVKYKDYGQNYSFMVDLEPEINVVKTVRFPSIYKEENESEESYYKRREENINLFKQHIKQYGSIYAVIQAPDPGTIYFNDKTSSQYFEDNQNIETRGLHAVSIVGWDDNYSKNKFNSKLRPKHDGAFIALNSWGDDYHEKGYFYISYEDANVLNNAAGVVSTSLKDAVRIDNISSNTIKNLILSKVGYNVIKKDGKEYVTDVALSRVNSIDLSNSDITNDDLKYISIFSNLSSLKLNNTNISDISKITELKELYSLDISNTKISDISGIEKLSNLNELLMSNTEISDISPAAKIKSLYNIDISNTKVSDVSALKDTYLSYLFANNLDNLNGVGAIDKLYYLEAKKTNLDISTLSGLEIASLDVSNNNMDGININLPKTGDFKCENCNITSLSNLTFGDYTRSVDLKNNQLSSLEGIENLKGITTLDLSNNKNIKDYSNINKIITPVDGSNNNEEVVNTKKIFLDKIKEEEASAVSVNYEVYYALDKEMLIVEKTKENNLKDYNFYNIVDGKINNLLSLNDVVSATMYYNYVDNMFSVILEHEDKYDFGNIGNANDKLEYTYGYELSKEDFVFDDYNSFMIGAAENSLIEFENNIRVLNYNTISYNYDYNEFRLILDDNDITDLTEIGNLNVSYLSLAKNKKLANIDKLVNVKTLNLSDCNISNLDEITKLTNLYSLDLTNNSITDISPLNNLENLKSLSLNGNKKLTGDLKLGLETLNIANCDLSDLSSFNLDDMTFINISENDGLGDDLIKLRDLGNMYVEAEDITLNYSDFANLTKCKGSNCSYISKFTVKYDSSKINNNKISIKEDSLQKYLLTSADNLETKNLYIEPKGKNLSVFDDSKESSISNIWTNNCSLKKLIFE